MSENSPSPKPTEIGRRTLRVLSICLLVVVLLFMSLVVLATVFDASPPDNVQASLFVAFALLSVVLIVAPGIAFLIHRLAHRDQGVSRRLRTSALLSAVAPASIAVLMITSRNPPFVTIGWILAGVAVFVIVPALVARKAETVAESSVLRSGYSFAGLVFVLLAATARPHSHPPGKAYITAMKSDLRNLVSAQESYFFDHKGYTTNLTKLGFRSSSGVNVPIVTVVPGGWHATTSHTQLSKITCGIAVNTTNPIVATAGDGEPACQ